jgi:hypothetical protein
MKPSPAEINELKETIGVKELDEVNEERFAQFLKRVAEGQLSEEQLNRLAFVLAQFLPLLMTTVEQLGAGARSVAEGAKSSQKAALDAMAQKLDAAHKTLLAPNGFIGHFH